MKLLKGIAQILPIDNDSYRVYTYVDSPDNENLQVILADKLIDTWWTKDQIAGTNNENFRKFHLWFEY